MTVTTLDADHRLDRLVTLETALAATYRDAGRWYGHQRDRGGPGPDVRRHRCLRACRRCRAHGRPRRRVPRLPRRPSAR
jgi:hypothetical protein